MKPETETSRMRAAVNCLKANVGGALRDSNEGACCVCMTAKVPAERRPAVAAFQTAGAMLPGTRLVPPLAWSSAAVTGSWRPEAHTRFFNLSQFQITVSGSSQKHRCQVVMIPYPKNCTLRLIHSSRCPRRKWTTSKGMPAKQAE